MVYILPKDVISPKASWQLDRVVIDGGPGKASWAIGRWESDPVIATRWNGTENAKVGMPQSRGLPTWFIIDEIAYDALIPVLAAANPKLATYVKEFLRPSMKSAA